MSFMYSEIGGLRWGQSFWNAANATWPFATLQIGRDGIELRMILWPFSQRFTLKRHEVECLKTRRGLFSFGVQVEHRKREYPPFILFWSFSPKTLLSSAQGAGYRIAE